MFRTTPESEETMFQFDEEMVKKRETQAPVYHIGRGGAANVVDESKPRAGRMGSTDSSASVSTEGSEIGARRSLEGAFGKFTRK